MAQVNAFEVTPTTSTPKTETLIHLILDETGSMNICRDSTISSFNEYLNSQSTVDDGHQCLVSLTKFSESYNYFNSRTDGEKFQSVRTVYSNTDVKMAPRLNHELFEPSGGTNLYDAIGSTIAHLDRTVRDNQNVLVVILTDGEENSSREYNLSAIRKMIEDRQAKGWTFIYLGANQNAWSVGSTMGLAKGQTMSYSTAAMDSTMSTLSNATTMYRSMRSSTSTSNAAGTTEKNFFGDRDA